MYDFGEERSLSALLEKLKGAAVAVSEGVVAEYNEAAACLLPDLRAGERLLAPEAGVIELCGSRFEATAFDVGEWEVYNFAAPADMSAAGALPLLENISRAIMENLSASFAAAELMAGAAKDDSLARHNAILRHEQYKLLNIAENLQELCALESGENVLKVELFELDMLCRKIIDTVAPLVSERGVEFEFCPEDAEFVVYADERRVERMILAVLANSVESCTGGGRVSLRLRKTAGLYELMIEDNGTGVPESVYDNVFESFARTAGTADGVRGTGLGLAVARSTALRHGGNLMLQSVVGEGTRVLISLPATKPEKTEFHSGKVEYAANPMRLVLSAFARVLSYKSYGAPYL